MANNKFMLRDGTVLLDLTADTVTANKILQGYTAHDASGAAIVGTYGSGSGYVDIFGAVSISASVGVVATTNEVVDKVGSLSMTETSAGFEGFNIAMKNLTVGTTYTVNFDFQYTDAMWFGSGQYMSGVKIYNTNYSTYSNYTDWTENIDRDLLKHNHQMTFTATAATMYLSFNVCGLSDSRVNYFEVTDFYVRETSQ